MVLEFLDKLYPSSEEAHYAYNLDKYATSYSNFINVMFNAMSELIASSLSLADALGLVIIA
jgi:hypothetical protein